MIKYVFYYLRRCSSLGVKTVFSLLLTRSLFAPPPYSVDPLQHFHRPGIPLLVSSTSVPYPSSSLLLTVHCQLELNYWCPVWSRGTLVETGWEG